MADAAGIDVKVSVEACVHRAIKSLAESVLKEHGLMLYEARIDWIETRSYGLPPEAHVDTVKVTSRTVA